MKNTKAINLEYEGVFNRLYCEFSLADLDKLVKMLLMIRHAYETTIKYSLEPHSSEATISSDNSLTITAPHKVVEACLSILKDAGYDLSTTAVYKSFQWYTVITSNSDEIDMQRLNDWLAIIMRIICLHTHTFNASLPIDWKTISKLMGALKVVDNIQLESKEDIQLEKLGAMLIWEFDVTTKIGKEEVNKSFSYTQFQYAGLYYYLNESELNYVQHYLNNKNSQEAQEIFSNESREA